MYYTDRVYCILCCILLYTAYKIAEERIRTLFFIDNREKL